MKNAHIYRWTLGVALGAGGLLAHATAGAKTLNLLWNQASPKPACAPANYNAKAEAFRLSGST